jgi:inorganic triphosphatase YgiF
MSTAQQEREDKYDVGADFAVPDLDDLVPPGGRLDDDVVTLDSEYFDTTDRDLLGQHVTLRRRSGDAAAGWQLKVPDRKARTEIRVPLTADDSVPDELAALISGVALGKPVHPVASISTVRRRRRLLDPEGHLLTEVAEVADDTVRATAAAAAGGGHGAVAGQGREVELELGETGDRKLLEAIGERLTRDDARPSRYPSKLSRALNPPGPSPAADDSGTETVRELLTGYLDTQVQAIVGGDVWLRRGLDPVHATRVGIRRFRSTLRVFKKVLNPAARTRLDAELS